MLNTSEYPHMLSCLWCNSVPMETVLIWCPVSGEVLRHGTPKWVTISTQNCGSPHRTLPVTSMHPRKLKYNFTVCLHQALVNYNNIARLVEWVEVNRLFGAERFIVYNRTADSSLMPYVRHYVQAGLMEIYPWNISKLWGWMSYKGSQNGVLLDCTYRTMYETRHLVLKDIDEIVVPTKHSNWAEMLAYSPCKHSAGIMIRHVMFDLVYEPDPQYVKNASLSALNLTVLSHTKKMNYTWDCGLRSKIIIHPERVRFPSVHIAESDDSCCMPVQSAELFHHRWFNETYYDTWKLIYKDRKTRGP